MREAGREAPQRRETIGATQPAFELAYEGHVTQDRDDAQILALAALERRGTHLDRQRRATPTLQREGDADDGRAAGQRLHQHFADLGRLREQLRAVPCRDLAHEEAGQHLRGRVQRHHAAVEIDGHDAVRERSEDVLGVTLDVFELDEALA